MQPRSRLSAKGQIVVPKAIRDRLGLSPGDQITFRDEPDGVRIERAAPEDDPFAAFSEWSSADDDEAYADL